MLGRPFSRAIHGKEGQGRLRFFSPARRAHWDAVYEENKTPFKLTIDIDADRLQPALQADGAWGGYFAGRRRARFRQFDRGRRHGRSLPLRLRGRHDHDRLHGGLHDRDGGTAAGRAVAAGRDGGVGAGRHSR